MVLGMDSDIHPEESQKKNNEQHTNIWRLKSAAQNNGVITVINMRNCRIAQ